jgi:hypothetical protein
MKNSLKLLALGALAVGLNACGNQRDWLAQKWVLDEARGEYNIKPNQQDSLAKGLYIMNFQPEPNNRFEARLPHGYFSGEWTMSEDGTKLMLSYDPGQTEPIGFGLDELGPNSLKLSQFTQGRDASLVFEPAEEEMTAEQKQREEEEGAAVGAGATKLLKKP